MLYSCCDAVLQYPCDTDYKPCDLRYFSKANNGYAALYNGLHFKISQPLNIIIN